MEKLVSGLVALQPDGKEPAIYCVPGAGGSVERLGKLARLMGADRPFYAFQVPGREEPEEPIASIEAVARHFIAVLRASQPSGPFLLAGYSWGGMVAYEMAQQLLRQGQQVALLAILDIAPLRSDMRRLRLLIDWLGARLGLSHWHQIRLLLRLRPVVQWFRVLPKPFWSSQGQKAAVHRTVVQGGNVVQDRTQTPQQHRPYPAEDLWAGEGSPNARVRRLVRFNDRVLRAYSPKPFVGSLALFRSSAVRATSDTLGWELFAMKGVQEFIIQGRHLDILNEPAVQDLADVLRSCLDRVGLEQKVEREPARSLADPEGRMQESPAPASEISNRLGHSSVDPIA